MTHARGGTTAKDSDTAEEHADGPAFDRLVFGTANKKKALELADQFGGLSIPLETLADYPSGPAVEETGQSFAENAALKATTQAVRLARWVLADDSGLVVDALKGAPGIHSARYAGPNADDAQNRAKLLVEMQNVPLERRGAHFVCHLALADPTGVVRATAEGRCHGRMLTEEHGSGGFGYDPLFEIIEYKRTFGQLASVVKGCLSHRAVAARAILPQLMALIDSSSDKQ